MSACKGIVLAFLRRREGAKTTKMTICVEGFAATCQNLMSGSLMSHIPNNAVIRRIEDIMQSNSQLDDSKSTCEMTWVAGHLLNNLLPKFCTDLRKCFEG